MIHIMPNYVPARIQVQCLGWYEGQAIRGPVAAYDESHSRAGGTFPALMMEADTLACPKSRAPAAVEGNTEEGWQDLSGSRVLMTEQLLRIYVSIAWDKGCGKYELLV